MKRVVYLLIILVVFVSTTGCMQRTRIADLTVMSSKNISTLEGATDLGIFEGKDCRGAFGGQTPSMEDALDNACEAGGGNAMLNAVIYYKPANCIFDNVCYEIKGTVIKTKDIFANSEIIKKDKEVISENYDQKHMITSSGHEYLALSRKSNTDVDSDKKEYEYIVRVR